MLTKQQQHFVASPLIKIVGGTINRLGQVNVIPIIVGHNNNNSPITTTTTTINLVNLLNVIHLNYNAIIVMELVIMHINAQII
jgi:hypothetical protein